MFAFLLGPASAAAVLPAEFGSIGSGPGQFGTATGVAVSQQTGDVYVLDRTNNRVDEFNAEGSFVRAWGWGVADGTTEALQICTTTCFAGLAGSGAGQFDAPSGVGGIAVDNALEDPLDSSVGDVYVMDQKNGRIEKFGPTGNFELAFAAPGRNVAVGPTGDVFVGEEGAIQEYSPEGASVASIAPEEAGTVGDFAVGSAGQLFVVCSDGAVREYAAAGGAPLNTVIPGQEGIHGVRDAQQEAVALGVGGVLFVDQIREVEEGEGLFGTRASILEFASSGQQIASFDAGIEPRYGFAFGATAGALYVMTQENTPGHPFTEQVRVATPPPPGPLIGAESVAEIEPTTAVVHAIIDPETGEEANEVHYRVEFGTTTSYESSSPVPDGTLPGSFDEDPITVSLTELTPRTLYHFRVVATNECEPEEGTKGTCTTNGPDKTFTTLPPALIESTSVTDVRSTSATLHAEINPLGSETTYHFSYGPTTACGSETCDVPAPEGKIAASRVITDALGHVQGLLPGTTYHYRVVASNAFGTVQSAEAAFTTQVPGEVGLPDGREWETVSPQDKHGAGIVTGGGHELFQSSASGDAIAWPATIATEAQPQGSAEFMQVLSTRGSTFWSSLDLEVPHSTPTGVPDVMEYPFFSEDLSHGLLDPFGGFEKALSAEASELTPYLRTDYVGGNRSHLCTGSCFRPLVTGCPAEGLPCPPPIQEHANVPPGTVFSPEPDGECVGKRCDPAFLDATPDLGHVLLDSQVALTETVIPDKGLYEWTNGKLALVSLLPPNEEGVEEPASTPRLGFLGESTTHAISDDGSRVFWEVEPGTVYMRDVLRHESIKISNGPFEWADAAGSKVFSAGQECEVNDSTVTGKLECTPVGEPYGRVLATSEDGSWVYYEKASSVFVRHGGATALIAAEVDGLRAQESPGEEGSTLDHWRVSPNGEWFAFMSSSPLTGYDNRDAASGVRDEEVFLYDAGHGRLICASCNPTGARPHGVDFEPIVTGWPPGTSIAAIIPSWTPYSNKFSRYQSRYLNDQGRLFFNSTDAIVPRDINGQQDVYEFEPKGVPAGTNACSPLTMSGSTVYVPSTDGCAALISSGESADESTFLDASASGGDVFFLSTGSLPPLVSDGSPSLIDAHECTPSASCFPPSAAPTRACDSESACKAPPAPLPAIFGASGSATFSGRGNVPSTTSSGPKVETRAQKLAKALRRCRHLHPKKHRKACEKLARKRYGTAKTQQARRAHRRAR